MSKKQEETSIPVIPEQQNEPEQSPTASPKRLGGFWPSDPEAQKSAVPESKAKGDCGCE